MLKLNPTWWVISDQMLKRKDVNILMKPEGVHMTFTLFKSILEKNNSLAKDAIIRGEQYNLGRNLGFILARRVERNFAKLKVNLPATMQLRKNSGDEKPVVYWSDDDYARIAWHKFHSAVSNISVYEFKAAKDFRLLFSKMIINTPGLKFKYLFFPLKSKA